MMISVFVRERKKGCKIGSSSINLIIEKMGGNKWERLSLSVIL